LIIYANKTTPNFINTRYGPNAGTGLCTEDPNLAGLIAPSYGGVEQEEMRLWVGCYKPLGGAVVCTANMTLV
jgi:hypothetical protein